MTCKDLYWQFKRDVLHFVSVAWRDKAYLRLVLAPMRAIFSRVQFLHRSYQYTKPYRNV